MIFFLVWSHALVEFICGGEGGGGFFSFCCLSLMVEVNLILFSPDTNFKIFFTISYVST